MNRAVWNIAEPPPADLLPPPERAAGAPVRMLFIQASELGFLTATRSLEAAAAARNDIEAVHLSGKLEGLDRLLAAAAPFPTGGLDQGPYRYMRVWASVLQRLFTTVLPPDRFDVIHIMPQQRGLVIPWLRRRTRAAIAVNIDATIPAYFRAFDRPIPRLSLARRAERLILRSADLVACWSRWASDSAVAELGVDPKRVTLFKPCAAAAPEVGPARREPGGPVRIAFVGNDFARKGGDRLLRWHQQRWLDRAELHICSAKAEADRSLKGVVWHGAVPHARLMGEILPACDLLVMPTREDTFLIAAQEAQAIGLPVVSSRLAGLPEVVRHGRTGFLFPRDDEGAFIDCVDRLISDADLRRRLSSAARQHARANLDRGVWCTHLMDQLVALASGQPPRFVPEGVDVRISDQEPASPASASESADAFTCRIPT